VIESTVITGDADIDALDRRKLPWKKLTLRDAAERTSLSITTLRRYIRSGRLDAEKTPGRYGPEYTISTSALERAGVRTIAAAGAVRGMAAQPDPDAPQDTRSMTLAGSSTRDGAPLAGFSEAFLREMIPIDLFRELSMKHEQLLVQYGMVRVGGQRMMEYKLEAERLGDALRAAETEVREGAEKTDRETGFLKKHLREAELEIEAKNQEIAALRERVRMLELLNRNAITNESIEQQFTRVFDKRLELEGMEASSSDDRRRKMAALDEMLRSGFRNRPAEEPTDQ
jgi:hypothetical protein